MSKQENNKDFETSLKKLEKIVSDLENGDLPLEESIKTFEEGVKLTKHCQNLLFEYVSHSSKHYSIYLLGRFIIRGSINV